MEILTNPTHLNTLGLAMDVFGFTVLFFNDGWKTGWKGKLGLGLIVIGFALQIASNYMPWSS